MKTKQTTSKRGLQKHLKDLIVLAKSVTPEVESIVHIPGDEGQHAWIKIYVPDQLADQIDDLLLQRASDIFIATGYDIATIVYEKSQLQDTAAEMSS